ncbi:NeuD/PglB/VioB family sugar acetyltransferase [Peteryoungia ipomoeae]|uniref:Acetyltransferase n=1 Tax=Peteryoungia ipomoeae TaxID=1210932 RepID=A0A4S8NZB1_9HYPH|nr:NeuD/PglB/VioB family sugar acetyltransferase [Peteryoungia ipomoeae]THV23070.1 acetyltransferase [Peteryoungia ipomoeae]
MKTNDNSTTNSAPYNSNAGIFILGFGGHARSAADVAVAAKWSRIIFIDANADDGEHFSSFPAIRTLPDPLDPNWLFFPAAGDNRRRRSQMENVAGQLATLVSPEAHLGVESILDLGTLVAHGAHVGPGAKIGRGVILNTHSIVEHEAQVGDFAHISVNAVVAGRSKIGSNVFLGAGAVVIDSVSVCSDVVIGAGAVVTSSIDEPGIYVGVPARRVK